MVVNEELMDNSREKAGYMCNLFQEVQERNGQKTMEQAVPLTEEQLAW